MYCSISLRLLLCNASTLSIIPSQFLNPTSPQDECTLIPWSMLQSIEVTLCVPVCAMSFYISIRTVMYKICCFWTTFDEYKMPCHSNISGHSFHNYFDHPRIVPLVPVVLHSSNRSFTDLSSSARAAWFLEEEGPDRTCGSHYWVWLRRYV